MTGLETLEAIALRSEEQLWYVAHPVHPTDEEVAAYRAREDEVISYHRSRLGPSPGLVVERRMSVDEIKRDIIKSNIGNSKLWLGWLARRFPSVTFIAPWIAALDGGGDDDLVPEQRSRGLRDCCRTIRACCGLIQVGGRVSEGMQKEAKAAFSVVDLTYLGRETPGEKVTP